MLKFAYVRQYQVGEKVEIRQAEELLASYNDFYSSNLEFYQGQMKASQIDDFGSGDEADDNADASQAEKSLTADIQAFEQAWGSLDFASATLVGLDIDWDAIQEKILAEQHQHLRPAASKLLPVAKTLRKVASILAFSERIVMRLQRKAVEPELIATVIQGFTTLLHQLHEHDIDIPELAGAEAKQLAKLKTVDGILDYTQQLLALGR